MCHDLSQVVSGTMDRHAEHYERWIAKHLRKISGVKERALARAKRTITQQLDALDKHLGKGVGAKKERARLLAKLMERAGGSLRKG